MINSFRSKERFMMNDVITSRSLCTHHLSFLIFIILLSFPMKKQFMKKSIKQKPADIQSKFNIIPTFTYCRCFIPHFKSSCYIQYLNFSLWRCRELHVECVKIGHEFSFYTLELPQLLKYVCCQNSLPFQPPVYSETKNNVLKL